MPSARGLLIFALTALPVIVLPGPGVLFVVGRALGNGRRVATLSVAGNSLGGVVQVVAVAIGVGALVQQSVAVFSAVKLIGGLYLVYLGVKTFVERRSLVSAFERTNVVHSDKRAFIQGFVVGVTNPKTMVFLAAILPQFVNPTSGSVPGQVLVLGLTFIAVALVSDMVWATAAGGFRSWFARSPRRLEFVGGGGGLAIVAVGINLLVSRRRD